MKRFFVRTKRHFIQLLTALLYNLDFQGIATLSVNRASSKAVCVPGLHCYSCPGAVGACPIGALQQALGASSLKLPFYVAGCLLAFGALFGRTICGWACPFGFIQDMLDKLGRLLRLPQVRKGAWSRRLGLLKYAMLALVVIGPIVTLTLDGVGSPLFCSYVCPAGTLAGVALVSATPELQSVIGMLFGWKTFVLAAIVLAAMTVYRPFCRFLCPLGALYGFFNRFCALRYVVDERACTHCNACVETCRMDVKHVSDRECIQCGECKKACAHGAIRFSVSKPCAKRVDGSVPNAFGKGVGADGREPGRDVVDDRNTPDKGTGADGRERGRGLDVCNRGERP